ncbi:unnamed protein product [Caenorhabditis bovis]|uniref:CTCK domain-containing protein n=1 Tax=Caenorhabditis bovis TaxID=2654633 RepID=A0A8S1ED32_9PELO|nr:unnamed protein product [Caenorhabditis bovis]
MISDRNATSFRDISRDAFLSLKGSPIEARLPPYSIEDEPPDRPPPPPHPIRHHHQKSKSYEGGHKREKVLNGRNQALLYLADPNGLRMTQKCDGQKFKQRVRVDGCLTKVVVNRLCHGTCASYFIPRMHPKKLKAAFKSCATCAPSEYDLVDIKLDCPGQNPPTATRTIVKVKSCKCREVSISSVYD